MNRPYRGATPDIRAARSGGPLSRAARLWPSDHPEAASSGTGRSAKTPPPTACCLRPRPPAPASQTPGPAPQRLKIHTGPAGSPPLPGFSPTTASCRGFARQEPLLRFYFVKRCETTVVQLHPGVTDHRLTKSIAPRDLGESLSGKLNDA
jgi:hypothetical protein